MSSAMLGEVSGPTGAGRGDVRGARVRLSRRDVADGALRILRVAGVGFGEAKRAAATVEHLEIHHGRGCASLLAALDRGALDAGALDLVRRGERAWELDAAGVSGLVVAARIGDLLRLTADPVPSVVRLPGLREPAALERAMLCAAEAGVMVVGEWSTAPGGEGGRDHDVVIALPAPEPWSGPALARLRRLGPSGVRLAAAQQRAATLADLSGHDVDDEVDDEVDDRAGAVLIARVGLVHDELDAHGLAVAGFTVESAAELAARTEHATYSGLEVPAPLWARFEREAKRWLVADA